MMSGTGFEYNIKIDLKVIWFDGVNCFHLAQNKDQ
jgi:hypothetical protein